MAQGKWTYKEKRKRRFCEMLKGSEKNTKICYNSCGEAREGKWKRNKLTQKQKVKSSQGHLASAAPTADNGVHQVHLFRFIAKAKLKYIIYWVSNIILYCSLTVGKVHFCNMWLPFRHIGLGAGERDFTLWKRRSVPSELDCWRLIIVSIFSVFVN